MPEMFDYARSVFEVIVINVILSGDNAVIIALAARNLPEDRRRMALAVGGALAITLQLAFTLTVSILLRIPGIRLVGALLLAAIACRLLRDDSSDTEDGGEPASFGRTIANIALANLVMSLDNAIAVAGVSRHDPIRLAVGLLISAGIIFGFSSIMLKAIARYRWVAYVGTGLLASTAAGMMWQDFEAVLKMSHLPLAIALAAGGSHGGALAFKAFIVSICIASPRWWPIPPTEVDASSVIPRSDSSSANHANFESCRPG